MKETNKGYYTYQELRDYIIPNIKVAIQNLHLADDKKIDYNDEFESNWDLYGIKELEGKRDEYKKQIMDILAAYQKEWNQLTDEEISKAGVKDEKTYNVFHKNFIKYKNWLGDENTEGSLLYKLKELNAQVDELETQKKPYDNVMTDMNTHSELNDPQFGLTDKEYTAVMNIVRMGDYTNNNIFTTSLDDAITSYEHCEELYQDGLKRISETSQPQYQIETSLDNILSLNEYADVNSDNKQGWHNQFTVGNFIRVGVRDDYAVKLRLLTIAYNPCTKSSEISVTYTNMITSLTGRDDFSYLFDDTAASQKNSISVGTGDSKDSVEYMTNMLQRMTNSSLFGNAVSNSVQNVLSDQGTINKLLGDYLEYKVIKVGNITGDKAEFNELFSKYINSEYIAANSADIKKLNTDVANINSAIIGASSTETGIVFNLSSANAKFDSAWIINGIAGKMTIGDLAAGDITISDTMRILSENGNFIMNGSAMQFLDKEGNVGIQIGYDTNKNPSIIIKDNKGVTVMTSQGITKDAIADGLIVNNMLGDKSVSKDKLSFSTVEANAQGGVDITQIYDGKGGLWGAEYTKTMTSVNNSLDQLTQDIANLNTAIDSVSLTGQQVFTETDTGISPTSITLTATVNNGAEIGKWYVDGIENTSYVSSDKSQITIPSSYMTNRKTAVIKVECTDTSKYDVMTLYKVADGASAYTVVANSSNGTTFEYNNTVYTETICTCKVLKGSKEVTAKSYVWYKQSSGSTEWKQIGIGARLTVSLKDKQNQKIKCSVEI